MALASLVGSGAAHAASLAPTPTVSLPCADQIAASNAPGPMRTTTLGRVAIDTTFALGAAPRLNEPDPTLRYFAKDGLEIRAGAAFELVVPPEWRGRLRIGWGNPGRPTTDLQVTGCRWTASPSQGSPPGNWLAFAGGYHVRSPACVSLLVRAAHRTRRVHVGVGVACPGEAPPPQPLAPS